jgi:hypothetical protein
MVHEVEHPSKAALSNPPTQRVSGPILGQSLSKQTPELQFHPCFNILDRKFRAKAC